MIETVKGSILASASTTTKSENQDAHGTLTGKPSALFIADGIGSFRHAREAAQKVIERFTAFVQGCEAPSTNENIRAMFKDASESLVSLAKVDLLDATEESNRYGTTAIALFDVEEEIVLAYVGNGAAWHIRPNFKSFKGQPPWSAVNMLNPHTVQELGKEALERYLSDEPDSKKYEPSIIRIVKDHHQGDIVMVCTDGIHSADQQRMGRVPNDPVLWIRHNDRMSTFYEEIAALLGSDETMSQDRLRRAAERFLERVRSSLDDDATIGVLITPEAFTGTQ